MGGGMACAVFVLGLWLSIAAQAAPLAQFHIFTENGAPIDSKETKVPAEFRFVGSDGQLLTGSMEIRAHGNSTLGFPKHSYKFELTEKSGFTGFVPEKDWVLLANYSDKTLMRNFLAFELSRALGARYSPRAEFVDIRLNGAFRGNYLLTERIKVSPARLNLAKLGPGDTGGEALTGGYLMEIYHRGAEKFNFRTRQGLYFNLKAPKELAPEQFRYIRDYVQTAEDELFSPGLGNYESFLDLDQFIAWYLVNELFRNQDAAVYASIYVHKDRGGKLAMGPVWDFDIAAGNINYDDNFLTDGWWIQVKSPWFRRLFQDPSFRAKVSARWQAIRRAQVESLFQLLNETAARLQESQRLNFLRWPILGEYVWPNYVVTGSYEGEVAYLRDWLHKRTLWLDSQWGDGNRLRE